MKDGWETGRLGENSGRTKDAKKKDLSRRLARLWRACPPQAEARRRREEYEKC